LICAVDRSIEQDHKWAVPRLHHKSLLYDRFG
jgi:hypothetical protein